jgi:hypothetical protein
MKHKIKLQEEALAWLLLFILPLGTVLIIDFLILN